MSEQFVSDLGASDAPQIRSAAPNPASGREPIKHLLIGSPPAVRATIHRLHVLHYAEAGEWSTLLAVSDNQLVITPNPGDMMSILIKYLRLE